MDGPRDCHPKGSKSEKDKYHMESLICGILKNDTGEFIYKRGIQLFQIPICPSNLSYHLLFGCIFLKLSK